MGNKPGSPLTLISATTSGKGPISAARSPPPRPAGATSSPMGSSSASPQGLPPSALPLRHRKWHGRSCLTSQKGTTSRTSTSGSRKGGNLVVKAQNGFLIFFARVQPVI